MKITVLMSTYNGAPYLKEQLESIFAQDIKGELNVLVRDDGSSDGTQEVLEKIQKEHSNFKWYQGENKKPARSFWELLRKAEGSDYYAFADQDDIWDKDKLSIAVEKLSALPSDNPLLYFSDVRTVDNNLNPISDTMVKLDNPVDYPRSLINNVCPGCTYVFNETARKLASSFDADSNYIYMHDWKLYKIVACFGHVFFDKSSHLSYRQHGDNSIGARKRKLGYIRDLIKRDRDQKYFLIRKKEALNLEKYFGDKMSEENKYLTHLIAHYDEDKAIKKAALKEKRFKYSRSQFSYYKHRIRKNRF